MKKLKLELLIVSLLMIVATGSAFQHSYVGQETLKMSKEELRNKIKGGWAAQTIGVTFGGPTEFQYNGTMIQDYQKIPWNANTLPETYEQSPGLYDDIYMDLTFVEVIEEKGLDAPVQAFANAYANADYPLWHANQQGRYNVLQGIEPSKAGHWKNNPHADDIDYQIEADYAGLMSPGMPNYASEISDKVGHIMNYGDGWYGGVFVGALYTQAFVSEDVSEVVNQALKTIPAKSDFYKTIADVIKWHKKYPDDWKQTWLELQRKWSEVLVEPDGVFEPFNIDANINAAYVVLGLLYGDGEFTKTMEIATRAGQDSDCNPATAAGILGTMYGYDNIPAYWKQGLSEVESMNFIYTDISLNDAYELSYNHALEVIQRNNGSVGNNSVIIQLQEPEPVRFEESFPAHYAVDKRSFGSPFTGGGMALEDEYTFDFEGIGFAVDGSTVDQQSLAGLFSGSSDPEKSSSPTHEFKVEVYIDGELSETMIHPTSYLERSNEIAWKFDMPKREHKVRLKLLNPHDRVDVQISDIVIYSDKPYKVDFKRAD